MLSPSIESSFRNGKIIFQFAILMTAISCISLSSCAKNGQRLINFEVKVNGKIAMSGKHGVVDTMPVEKMWDIADDVMFEMSKTYLESNGTSLDDSETHEVKGDIVVRIKHVDSELASSSVPSLKFKKANSDSWKLSAGEVDLLKQASTKK